MLILVLADVHMAEFIFNENKATRERIKELQKWRNYDVHENYLLRPKKLSTKS